MVLPRRRRIDIAIALLLCLMPGTLLRDSSRASDDDARIEASAKTLLDALAPDPLRIAARPRPPVSRQPAQTAPTTQPAPAEVPRVDVSDDISATFPQGEPDEHERLQPLTPQQTALRDRVRRVLGFYYTRPLNSRDHNPWEMMHAIIAFGVETEIRRGGPNGAPINAVSYLCGNGTCHGHSLLFMDGNRINARKGPYVQGHYAQLMAILAQSRVPLNYPLYLGEKRFTLGDLIETEKWNCDENMELTFKLIAFSHYCDTDMTWTNSRGEEWSLPRIIKAELAAPILSNAACGGTHRLTGFAYAVRNRKRQGKPIEGEWLRAQKYLDDYHRYTLALQNSDGSFSTEWFRRREAKPDLDRRLQTSGHILEWLVYSLPAEQLDHPQVVKAVNYLTSLLQNGTSRKWEIGPLGHALHALALYDIRRYKPFDVRPELAQSKRKPTVKPVAPPAEPDDEEIGECNITDEPESLTAGAPTDESDESDELREARRRPLFDRGQEQAESSNRPRGPFLRWRDEREAEAQQQATPNKPNSPPPAQGRASVAQQPRNPLGSRLQIKPESVAPPPKLAPPPESIAPGVAPRSLLPIADPALQQLEPVPHSGRARRIESTPSDDFDWPAAEPDPFETPDGMQREEPVEIDEGPALFFPG